MSRRKWTLVILIVCVCPLVYSRPSQETITHSVVPSSITTETPSRYNSNNFNNKVENVNRDIVTGNISIYSINNANVTSNNVIHRQRRKLNSSKNKNKNSNKENWKRKSQSSRRITTTKPKKVQITDSNESVSRRKPTIRKIITKWKDKVDLGDINFDTSSSTEDLINVLTSTEIYSAEDNSLETSSEDTLVTSKIRNKIYATYNTNKVYRPQNEYTGEMHVYSPHLHTLDSLSTKRPAYTFNTPKPTPIITNVGNPQTWYDNSIQYPPRPIRRKPTTPKPIQLTNSANNNIIVYDDYNNVHNNYPHEYASDHNTFEVSTFQPVNAHTDRIIIRPEEYSASPEDCPTIFLTLNNTFQGQGKEACPDLNIAVNTNVINKNVVVESEEEGDEEESFFPDGFGLPLEEESSEEELSSEGLQYNPEETESASVESNALTNYNAAPQGGSQAIQAAPSPGGSPSGALSNLHNALHKDDDDFFSALSSFLRPAFNIIGWFATVNPLNFGLFSLLMTPIALAIAGTSGVTALFAPWAISYGREAPKVVHVYRPQWKWNDENKTWDLHSFPHNRKWQLRHPRTSAEVTEKNKNSSIKYTWFYKLKRFLKATTDNLYKIQNSNRKSKRKKREAWTRIIK